MRKFKKQSLPLLFVVGMGTLGGAQHANAAVFEETAAQNRGVDSVGLNELLEHAKDHAPAVLVALGAAQSGAAQVEAAKRFQPFNPSVSVGIGQRKQAGQKGLDVELGLAQQLRIFGQRGQEKKAAQFLEDRTHMDVDVVRWAVHVQLHRNFDRALMARERADLAEKLAAFNRNVERIVEQRVNVGEESPVVLELAKAVRILAETKSLQTKAEVEVMESLLAELAGWPVERDIKIKGKVMPVDPAGNLQELLTSAAENNPALAQSIAQSSWTQSKVELEKRRAWPSPTVGVQYAREAGIGGGPGNGDTDIWMGSLSIPIPVFARQQAPRLQAKARHQAAKTVEDATRQRLSRRVHQAVIRVDATGARVLTLETEVVAAYEHDLNALRRAYEVGELDLFQLAQARQRLWEVRLAAVDAREEYIDAVAELESLLGSEVQAHGGVSQ